VIDGKAPLYVIDEDLWPDWYRSAESVLRLKPKRSGVLHNVTPAVLSRDGARALLDHAARLFRERPLRPDRRTLRLLYARARSRIEPGRYEPERLYLASMGPWTEYALYYTFLESTGLADRYHRVVPTCIYAIEGSLWYAESFDAWEPSAIFAKPGAPYFLIVQSNTGIAPERVWERVRGHVNGTRPREAEHAKI
jgi:hypothetical protein